MQQPDNWTELLSLLLSPQDAQRHPAEQTFRIISDQDPQRALQASVDHMQLGMPKEIRQLAAVLLQRLLGQHSELIQSPVTPALKAFPQSILSLFLLEEDWPMQRLLSHVLIRIVKSVPEWPEFSALLFSFCAEGVQAVDSHMYLLKTLQLESPDLLRPLQKELWKLSSDILGSDPAQVALSQRESALEVYFSLVIDATGGPFHAALASSFSDIMQSFFRLLEDSGGNRGHDAFKLLIDTAIFHGDFISLQVPVLLAFCSTIMQPRRAYLDSDISRLVLEVLADLLKYHSHLAKSHPELVSHLLNYCFLLLTRLEDDPDWEEGDGEQEFEKDPVLFASEILLGVCDCLYEKHYKTKLETLCIQYLTSNDWKEQYAGLVGLGCHISKCTEDSPIEIVNFLDVMLPLFQSGCHRVVFLLLDTLDSCVVFLGSSFVPRFSHYLIQAYVLLLQETLPRPLIGKLFQCLDNICSSDFFERSIIITYRKELIERISEFINNDSPFIRSCAIGLLSSLFCFQEYAEDYIVFLPRLIAIASDPIAAISTKFGSSSQDGLIRLRSKTLDCIGNILQNHQGVLPLQDMLLSLFRQRVDLDDPSLDSLLDFCSKLANYQQLLLVPHLADLTFLLRDIMNQTVEHTCSIEETPDLNDSWETVTLKNKGIKLSLNATAIDSIHHALTVTREFSQALPDHFLPAVSLLTDPILRLLSFKYSGEIRTESTSTLVAFFQILLQGKMATTLDYFRVLFSRFVVVISEEEDIDVRRDLVHELYRLFEACFGVAEYDHLGQKCQCPFLIPYQLLEKEVYPVLFKMLEECLCRRQASVDSFTSLSDVDEEAEQLLENQQDVEENILSHIVDILCFFFKFYSNFFMEPFKKLFGPIFLPMLGHNSASLRCSALSVFLDALRFLDFPRLVVPESGVPESRSTVYLRSIQNEKDDSGGVPILDDVVHIWREIMPIILQDSINQNVGLRQTCIYGLGLLSQKNPVLLQTFADVALERVSYSLALCHLPEDGMAYDNCVSVFYKFLRSGMTLPDPQGLFVQWLEAMPLVHDSEEAIQNHRYLVECLMSRLPQLLSHADVQIRMVLVLARIILNDTANDKKIPLCDSGTRERIPNVIHQICTSYPEALESLVVLSDEQKRRLRDIL